MTVSRIVLVSDDPALSSLLAEQLETFEGLEFETRTSACGLDRSTGPGWDLVLVDEVLADSDGSAVCRALRGAGVEMPIIGLAGSEERARGMLAAGATISIAKPFRFDELSAGMNRCLETETAHTRSFIPVGRLRFVPGIKALFTDGSRERIALTEKETQILLRLYRSRGTTVSRETLLREVWGYHEQANTHTLETHIYRLRRKIETCPGRAAVLLTDPGGYRLMPGTPAPRRPDD